MTLNKLCGVAFALTLALASCTSPSSPSAQVDLPLGSPSAGPLLSTQSINLTAGGAALTLNVGSVPAGQTVTWTATPAGVGILASNGSRATYTPPTNLTQATDVTITVRLSSGASGSMVLTIAPSVQTAPAPTPTTPTPTPPAPSTPPSSNGASMLSAINAVRAQARSCGTTAYPAVPALKWSTQLEAAALLHSQDMADKNYFSHTSQDGRSPWDRIKAQGYVYRAAGENIAAGLSSVEGVIEGWVQSPGHCVNLMSASYTEVGMAKGENASSTYRIYWTQNFAKPM